MCASSTCVSCKCVSKVSPMNSSSCKKIRKGALLINHYSCRPRVSAPAETGTARKLGLSNPSKRQRCKSQIPNLRPARGGHGQSQEAFSQPVLQEQQSALPFFLIKAAACQAQTRGSNCRDKQNQSNARRNCSKILHSAVAWPGGQHAVAGCRLQS